MGISRDTRHKRKLTGGAKHQTQAKRKFELGRVPANTKLAESKRIHAVRTRGGNQKFRALRLDKGNFSWGSENVTRTVRIVDVVYNASNNELVRTKTLVKNCIVEIDASEFKKWYETHYGVTFNKKGVDETPLDSITAKSTKARLTAARKERILDPLIQNQLSSQGRLLACISSRPGQCGRADGYVLEGKELEFYQRMLLQKKKGATQKAATATTTVKGGE
jgi:small subunit ribosomal protein S8e